MTQSNNANSRCWVAAYTRARHEHQVAQQLQQKHLECLLPTYERVVRWTDRVKRSRTPLFPQYVFVNISNSEHVPVLQTMGVVKLISRSGEVVALSSLEIERLRLCSTAANAEPHPYLKLGRRVRVKRGAFAGWEGTLVEKQNSYRLVINIEQIMKAVAISISAADVEPVL